MYLAYEILASQLEKNLICHSVTDAVFTKPHQKTNLIKNVKES